MISCTEFIPAYSEGFKFLELISGSDEPQKFWRWLSAIYLKDSLEKLMTEKGLEGCFEYWSASLNEEAAEFSMRLDEIKGEFTIEMGKCPSKNLLDEMKHLKPYRYYCDHCEALYRPVAEKLGYDYEEHHPGDGRSSCRLRISVKDEL